MIIKIILIGLSVFSWGFVCIAIMKSSLGIWLKPCAVLAVLITILGGVDRVIAEENLAYIFLTALFGAP